MSQDNQCWAVGASRGNIHINLNRKQEKEHNYLAKSRAFFFFAYKVNCFNNGVLWGSGAVLIYLKRYAHFKGHCFSKTLNCIMKNVYMYIFEIFKRAIDGYGDFYSLVKHTTFITALSRYSCSVFG